MASVLVDLEDISYIDDITDEELINSEEESCQKAKKRKKNTLIGERLMIDPNEELVKELRQERQESKKELYPINEGNNQIDKDLDRLQKVLKEQDKHKVLQELREERAQLITESKEERNKPEDQEHKGDDHDSAETSKLYKPKQCSIIKEGNHKMNKDIENKDIKRKSQENMNMDIENTEDGNEDDSKSNVEDNTKQDNTAEINEIKDKSEAHEEVVTELSEVNDKSKLVNSGSKLDLRSKGKRQRSPSVGKENVNVEKNTDSPDGKDKKLFANENETDTALLLQEDNISDIGENDHSDFNGAKPKLYTRRVNGRDMQLKELNLEIYPNPETSGKAYKGKAAKKKSYKANLDSSEEILDNTTPDIKILITNEDGNEVIAHMSESTTGTSKDTWNCSKSELSSPSGVTSSTDTGRSTPLNYLRKMSEDNEGKKSNHLLEQQELYKQQKAKPFQNFSKVKVGQISTGIEGDSKRSYIKTMTIMPDKKLVLFDRKNRCLKLFDKEFNPLDKINITSKYCGLVAVFEETLAATLPGTRKLQFYHIDRDTNKMTRERTHPVEGEFYSITYHHHRIYMLQRIRTHNFTEHDKWEIKRLNINKNTDETKTLHSFSPGHKDFNLLANDHGLYITNRLENEVLMMKHDGTYLYRHKTDLSLPVGITSDKFGNIYVCGGSMTSFIEVIKPDLKRYRMIYKKTSSNPVAMCFNKEENILYISDQIIGKVIKYRIQHNGTIQGLMRSMLIRTPSQDS